MSALSLSLLWPLSCVVNRTALLPGRTCGKRCPQSLGGISLVNGAAAPPEEDTRTNALALVGVKTIFPSSPQLAPAGIGASHKVIAPPPRAEIFLRLPSAKKPIHWSSGEKNGDEPF